MKVRYLGISDPLELLNGKVYDVVSVEGDWYRIVDETQEDYLYPPQYFEVVEPNDGSTPSLTYEECAATVESSSWCGSNDSCYAYSEVYTCAARNA